MIREAMATVMPPTLPADLLDLADVDAGADLDAQLADLAGDLERALDRRGGRSKIAKKPSPAVSISRPPWRAQRGADARVWS